MILRFIFCLLLCCFLLACSDGTVPRICEPDEKVACICSSGLSGSKVCSSGGTTWSFCRCNGGHQQQTEMFETRPETSNNEKPFEKVSDNHKEPLEKNDEKPRKEMLETIVPEEKEVSNLVERTSETALSEVIENFDASELLREYEPEVTQETVQEGKAETQKHPPMVCQAGETRPCYTAPAGCQKTSSGSYQCKGVCKSGIRTCTKGVWSTCRGEVNPSKEQKDGMDNNCDGYKDEHFQQISAGYSHNCVLLSNGTVKCWGYNGYFQLQSGWEPTVSTPTTLTTKFAVKQIAMGAYTSCFLFADHTFSCRGNNSYGELGNEIVPIQTTPVKVQH